MVNNTKFKPATPSKFNNIVKSYLEHKIIEHNNSWTNDVLYQDPFQTLKLYAKLSELHIVNYLMDTQGYLPKKYAYKSLQFLIVKARDYFNKVTIDKPQKIANLPDYVNLYKIQDYTNFLNEALDTTFNSLIISLAIDSYLEYKMTENEKQEELYKNAQLNFSYDDMNKTSAKFQELVVDRQYHNLGYVSAKTLWLTFQFFIEHVIDCGKSKTATKSNKEMLANLPEKLVTYKLENIFNALNECVSVFQNHAA